MALWSLYTGRDVRGMQNVFEIAPPPKATNNHQKAGAYDTFSSLDVSNLMMLLLDSNDIWRSLNIAIV